jgi:hypothetical protein
MSAIIVLTDRHRYFLYTQPADIRKSFAGLCGIVNNIMQLPISDNDVFVFLNRDLSHLKLLLHESAGFTLLCRRLDKGRFKVPDPGNVPGPLKLSAAEVIALIKGLTFYRDNGNKNPPLE